MSVVPKVSVIIPVYNSERFLEQSLSSILRQTLHEIEVICVDDGSSDDSTVILNRFASDDPRVRVITQENGGAGKARNTGLAVARGEYLSFLDADDFFEPNMLEIAYAKAVSVNADLVVFKSDQFYEEDNSFRPVSWTLRSEYMPAWEPFSFRSITCNVFRAYVGWTWDKLFRAGFVRECGLCFQEQRTTNDMLFVFGAVVLAQRIAVLDNVLAHQRRNAPASLSNTRELSWDCFFKALCALRDTLYAHDLYWQIEADYVDYCLHACLWNLDTLQGPKKAELFNKLHDEWFDDLGITRAPKVWFTNKQEYDKYKYILTHPLDSYIDKYQKKIK